MWGATSPNVVHEQSLHPDYISVMYGFTADYLLGPFFFEENTPHGPQWFSITGARYCDLLQQQIIPALQERQCLETIVFEQDDA
ncbi:hypothetical protein AVEN_221070-1 [Araneus ventricosus]|uniref:Uncharacterized protein n=1 Tax=Araneus ventricosus TaxID=182803 RepID=A0A4Y2DVH9_ARAVE|nr:hypothetical protein AVEN_258076-1 [Araneus ventricosus]GBM20353.1 hypothetical protein AVEN_112132-1 [Araneus ventricosus]GBM20359.1 hypothetical protein AVEN_188741-1 [Araneus ventricosus]GBM20366.1 hypothetical protein AVEN_221070-1 [Araneus ventricosus]